MTGLGQICLATFFYNTVYDFCLQNFTKFYKIVKFVKIVNCYVMLRKLKHLNKNGPTHKKNAVQIFLIKCNFEVYLRGAQKHDFYK